MDDIAEPDRNARIKALAYRAWHRGTREADYMIGGFFDAHHASWSDAEIDWFEAVIDEQDVDIMAWALGRSDPPAHLAGPLVERLRRLDYIVIPC
jgi:antitoxin CptB